MIHDARDYLAGLKQRSSEELHHAAQELALHEKETTASIIAHIAEIEARGYHTELGYESMFAYCVKCLKLSEGSVNRRLQVAHACQRFPQLLDALAAGQLHLTSASLIVPCLEADNVETVIADAAGKTRRQVEEIVAALVPKELYRPSVRKLPSRTRRQDTPELSAAPGELGVDAEALPEAGAVPPIPRRPFDRCEPATEDRYNFRFSADREFTEKFRRLAEVLGVTNPDAHIEGVLAEALELALEKKDPSRKLKRRREREAKKQAQAAVATADAPAAEEHGEDCPGNVPDADDAPPVGTPAGGSEPAATPSRYISSAIRERVLERADYRCEYRGPDGTRCTCRIGLQIEHTRPFAVHGSHDEDDLKAYCPAHNLHAAREYYGKEFIERKIAASRRRRETVRCDSA